MSQAQDNPSLPSWPLTQLQNSTMDSSPSLNTLNLQWFLNICLILFEVLRFFVQKCLPFYPEFYLLPVLVLVELLYQSLNLLLIPRTEVYKHLRHRPRRKLPQSHLSLQLRMQVIRCWLWLSDGCLSVAFSRYGIGAPAWARLHRSCRCCPHRAIRRWASPVSFMKSHKKSWVLNCKFQIMSMCMMCMCVCVCNFSKCQIQRYVSICHKVQDIFWENQCKNDEKKKTWNSKPVKTIRV